jgi:hypothetical protein
MVSNETLEFSIAEFREIFNYAELGLSDKRSADRCVRAWDMLSIFAKNFGQIQWDDELTDRGKHVPRKEREQFHKRVQELRNAFRNCFPLEGEPFPRYKKERGYETGFTIIDSRDGAGLSADERMGR